MRQKHVFYCKVLLDTSDNHVCFSVIQGPVKKDVDNHYVVFYSGHDHWIHKNFLSKIEPVQHETADEFLCWSMGFVWEDGDDERYIEYLAGECQLKCKRPALEYFEKIHEEISNQENKLITAKYCFVK